MNEPQLAVDPDLGAVRPLVAVVTAEESVGRRLRRVLTSAFEVRTVADAELALPEVRTPPPADALIVDGAGAAAADLLAALQKDAPGVPVVLIAPADAGEARIQALRHRDWDVLGPQEVEAELVVRVQRVVSAAATQAQLTRADAAVAQANHQLERFAYTASHDLKEPLRAVTGFSRLLQTRYADQLDDNAKTYINFIVDGAERLATMIEGLRRFSRLARAAPEPVPVELAEAVAHVLEDLDRAEATVEVGNLPTVETDRHLLEAVLAAVLENALLYVEQGQAPKVSVQAAKEREGWRIDVADQGIGIAAEHHDRIFEFFTRLHPRERYAGQGLGLAIAAMAAARLHGDLTVSSGEGQGTTMSLTLPATWPG